MKDRAKHILIYRDSEINALRIAKLLRDNAINPIIKNEFQQSLVSGFGTNYENSVEIWVLDYEVSKAKQIIDDENNKTTTT